MNLEEKICRYNELTVSWVKGCDWVSQPGRTGRDVTRGEEKLARVFKELSTLYFELKMLGIPVYPEQTLDTSIISVIGSRKPIEPSK